MRRCFWLPPAICLLVVARPDQCVAVSNAAFCAPATVLSKSAPRTLHCRSPLSASVAPRDDVVHAATEAWLKEWVIDLRLCPWARLTRGKTPAGAPYSKVLVLRGGEERIDELAAAVWAEAAALQDRERARINVETSASPHDESRFFTTLLIFPDSAFGGQGPANCGAFPKLVRTAQALLHHDRGTESADGECALGVDLLAFHRWRLDEGPGTTTCPDDAAHFSVRSPFPTIQLLLTKDLEWARRQWQLREDRASRLPGALGLLSANKAMLREKGAEVLAGLMDGLSSARDVSVRMNK